MSDKRRNWICSTLEVSGGTRVEGSPTQLLPMGVADKDKLWAQGTELKVRFLQGSPELQRRTLKAAGSWFLDGVNLKLRPVQPGEKSDIRIAFNPNSGSWSYVGTDCTTIHPSQPTMNLGWATMETPEKDFSSVVIHEFGHALGLLHEHNHPGAKIEWDKSAVYADLGGDPNNWDKETIDDNVFAKFDAGKVITTDFDNVSVMIYTVPPNWTTNGKSFMPSWKLSPGDEATIQKLYG
jgi:serralysin